MKALCAAVAMTFACATGSASSGGASNATNTAKAQSCSSPMVPATVYRGTDVLEGPDQPYAHTLKLREDTPVCASTSSAGFGYRRIRLANGQTGYVPEASLSI